VRPRSICIYILMLRTSWLVTAGKAKDEHRYRRGGGESESWNWEFDIKNYVGLPNKSTSQTNTRSYFEGVLTSSGYSQVCG
jgi:hypothetical protein